MSKDYDLVVVGAGTAAMPAATRVRAAGKTVAVTDFRPLGGTCALRGCDPKKMLMAGTSAVDHLRRMRGHGVLGDARMTFEADLVVHAGGRAPDFAPLDLGTGGVKLEHGRLALNEYLQSVSKPAVSAAGDAAQMVPPLTPVSTRDARAPATNIL